MKEIMPWLDAADEAACRAFAEIEILAAGVFNELVREGSVREDGEPRRLLAEYRQLRQAQVPLMRELGMTPASRMALKVGDSRARSLDLAAAFAKLRQTRAGDTYKMAGQHDQGIDKSKPEP